MWRIAAALAAAQTHLQSIEAAAEEAAAGEAAVEELKLPVASIELSLACHESCSSCKSFQGILSAMHKLLHSIHRRLRSAEQPSRRSSSSCFSRIGLLCSCSSARDRAMNQELLSVKYS